MEKETTKLFFKPMLTWGAVAAVLAFVLVLGSSDRAYAGTFTPTLAVQLSTTEPETSADTIADFNLPATDVNFAGLVNYIPKEWGVVPGDQFPIGTDVGFLDTQATLGLLNAPCNQSLPVHFDFKNASINIEDTVSFTDTDEPDTGDEPNTADYAEDKDGNGLQDAIDKYPEFLNRVFDNAQPIRRSAGITIVAGIPVLLQFLIFEPGTKINDDIEPNAERGFPTVTALQNAGDTEAKPKPGAITDFCAPLITKNTSLGVSADGDALFVNPKAGTYKFTIQAFGQRDADNDGFENSLDTCPLDPNVGSPKISLDGDLDSDGLDAACDPNGDAAAGGTDSDEDADGYQNRQDNCPLVANGEEEDNQKDDDLDQIGNACDPNPDVADGELIPADLSGEIVIGGGGPGGTPACTAEGGANGTECWYDGYVLDLDETPSGDNDTATPTDTGETPVDGSPTVTAAPEDGDDDGGSSGVLIAVAVIAAVVIIGGGAALMMRRKSS